MKYAYLAFAFLVVLLVSAAGFRGSTFTRPPIEVFPDMDRQPKYKPQMPSTFFGDGRTDRPPPAHTVARSLVRETAAEPARFRLDQSVLLTGKEADGAWTRSIPVPVTRELVARGQERYAIYCSACHGLLGDGQGVVAKYGWAAIANLIQTPITERESGDIYNTITNGKNTMYPYGDKLSVEDRWAVVLYVRALQRAANGRPEDVPAGARKELGL